MIESRYNDPAVDGVLAPLDGRMRAIANRCELVSARVPLFDDLVARFERSVPAAMPGVIASGTPPPHDRTAVERAVVIAAREQGLDPALVRAVVTVESGGNPVARSASGALGLMQLMPATARELGVTDPFDPMQNVRGGAAYLRSLLDRFGDVRLALAAYNAGPAAVERAGGIPRIRETQEYVERVTRAERV